MLKISREAVFFYFIRNLLNKSCLFIYIIWRQFEVLKNKVVNAILKKIFGGEKNAYVQEGYGSFGNYIVAGGGN